MVRFLSGIAGLRCRGKPGMRDAAPMLRPLFHFTPQAGWMNDPNGLVYFEGEYHLFYQYNPLAPEFGPMHWGHAVSTDLAHWEHLPIALTPDDHGLIYSGSAVVDWENTSGFGVDGKPPLIAVFTYHDSEKREAGATDYESQAIAYSIDKGRSWIKYGGNPVLTNMSSGTDFRDPKVFWYTDHSCWIMALAAGNAVEFYASPDLKTWQLLSDFRHKAFFGTICECPDLFPIFVKDTALVKWVLIVSVPSGGPQGGSGTLYFVGDFDGISFRPDHDAEMVGAAPGWLDWGSDFYAAVTWSGGPGSDHKKRLIGWMSNWLYAHKTPADGWRGVQSVPREAELVEQDGGYRLISRPCIAGHSHFPHSVRFEETGDERNRVLTAQWTGIAGELHLGFPPCADKYPEFEIALSNNEGDCLRSGYEQASNRFFMDRRSAGETRFSEHFAGAIQYFPKQGQTRVHNARLWVDGGTLELYTDDGAGTMSVVTYPSSPYSQLKISFPKDQAMCDTLTFRYCACDEAPT